MMQYSRAAAIDREAAAAYWIPVALAAMVIVSEMAG
jgi:hypothetical protein